MKGINFALWQEEMLKQRALLNGKTNIYRTESLGEDSQKNLTPQETVLMPISGALVFPKNTTITKSTIYNNIEIVPGNSSGILFGEDGDFLLSLSLEENVDESFRLLNASYLHFKINGPSFIKMRMYSTENTSIVIMDKNPNGASIFDDFIPCACVPSELFFENEEEGNGDAEVVNPIGEFSGLGTDPGENDDPIIEDDSYIIFVENNPSKNFFFRNGEHDVYIFGIFATTEIIIEPVPEELIDMLPVEEPDVDLGE